MSICIREESEYGANNNEGFGSDTIQAVVHVA